MSHAICLFRHVEDAPHHPEPAGTRGGTRQKMQRGSATHDFGPKEKTRNPPEPAPEPAVFRRCPTRFARFMVSHRDFIILLLKSGVEPYFWLGGLPRAWPGACRADPWNSRILRGGGGHRLRPSIALTPPASKGGWPVGPLSPQPPQHPMPPSRRLGPSPL